MILVTGGSGFVGSALVRALQAQLADKLAPTAEPVPLVLALRSAQTQPQVPGVRGVVVGELGSHTRWDAAVPGVHTVYHCAARVHQLHEAGDALAVQAAYSQANVDASLHLARQAALHGVRRMVFISSIKVLGESTAPGQAFTANDLPQPRDAYGLSKMQAEQGLRAIARQTGMEVTIVRLPLVYGPGVKANFARLLGAVRSGLPLPLGAVRDNRRSFLGMDNLVDLLLRCGQHPLAANQTFLASDGEDVSTAELLRRMGVALGRPARLWPVPPGVLTQAARWLGQEAQAQRLLGSLQVDMRATCERLGWTPPVSLDEGLRRMVQGSGQEGVQ